MPKKNYLKLPRCDGAELIEETLKRQIDGWQKQPSLLPVDRIFPLFGNPGVGKTRLLEYMAEKHNGVLIDLGTRLLDHATHVAFIHDCRQKIESEHTRKDMKKLFLIDHVPEGNDDIYLDEFQDKILLPYLKQESFFVMSQQDPDRWCWDSSLPHTPPYILRGFADSRKSDVLKSLADGRRPASDLEKKIFNVEETYPLLVQKWDDLNGDIYHACEEFLGHWIAQVEPIPAEEQGRELKIAGAMSWLDSLTDSNKVGQIATAVGEEVDFENLRKTLGGRRWTAAFGRWEEPVRTILNVWFRCAEPGLAEKLDAQFGGGS